MFSMCYQLFEKYHKRKKLFRIKSILNLYSLEVIMTSTRIRKISFAFLKNRFHTFRYNMLLTLRKIYHYIVARYWTLREKKDGFCELVYDWNQVKISLGIPPLLENKCFSANIGRLLWVLSSYVICISRKIDVLFLWKIKLSWMSFLK